MHRDPTALRGAATASLAAGPIFLTSLGLATMYLEIPEPVVIGWGEMLSFLVPLIPAAIFGFVLALAPNLLGSKLMLAASERIELARSPLAWAGVGAGLGGGIAALSGVLGDDPATAFGLVATSALCAGICRRSARWDENRILDSADRGGARRIDAAVPDLPQRA